MNEIRKLRDSVNMTQKEFSNYFSIPIGTVQDWEHGRRNPPIYVIAMIKRLLAYEKNLIVKA